MLAQLLVKEGERVSAGQLRAVTDAMQVVEAIVDKANAELSLAEIAAQG